MFKKDFHRDEFRYDFLKKMYYGDIGNEIQ